MLVTLMLIAFTNFHLEKCEDIYFLIITKFSTNMPTLTALPIHLIWTYLPSCELAIHVSRNIIFIFPQLYLSISFGYGNQSKDEQLPLFRLKLGVAPSSDGIACARNAGKNKI